MDSPTRYVYKRWPHWVILIAICAALLTFGIGLASAYASHAQGLAPFVAMVVLIGGTFLLVAILQVRRVSGSIELSNEGITWRRGQTVIARIEYGNVKAVEINPFSTPGYTNGWYGDLVVTYIIMANNGAKIKFDTTILNSSELLAALNANIPDFKAKTKNPYWPWENNWR